jgi:voltage-gated potassium channel
MTITTVGYRENYQLDNFGKLFTIMIAVFGIGSLFYVLSVFMENLFAMQILKIGGKKKMEKTIENYKNHIIIVGYGRVGRLAANELLANKKHFVIIDKNIENNYELFEKEHFPVIKGDATEDDSLIQAGISRASGMIVTTANPATTVFIILSAKVLNPNIVIVARADEESSFDKMKRAGADHIVNPYFIGGQRLANLLLRPNVVDFLEMSFDSSQSQLNIENIKIPKRSVCFGKSLKELDIRKNYSVTILAIIRASTPNINPDSDFIFQEGDQLLVLGTREQLHKLDELLYKRVEKIES